MLRSRGWRCNNYTSDAAYDPALWLWSQCFTLSRLGRMVPGLIPVLTLSGHTAQGQGVTADLFMVDTLD